jgi:hypothetical protein
VSNCFSAVKKLYLSPGVDQAFCPYPKTMYCKVRSLLSKSLNNTYRMHIHVLRLQPTFSANADRIVGIR